MAVMAGLGLFWTASWPPCTPAAVLKGDQTLQVSIPYFFMLGKQKILITLRFCFHVDLNFVDTVLLGILGILFICHTITIITKRCKKKCRKRWRGGLKETTELMLIRSPQLHFFEDGIKITATDTALARRYLSERIQDFV